MRNRAVGALALDQLADDERRFDRRMGLEQAS
jgi:hypothetical protein